MTPDGDNLMYVYPAVISATAPEQLWEAVQAMVAGVKLWRESNYFVEATDWEPPFSNNSLSVDQWGNMPNPNRFV